MMFMHDIVGEWPETFKMNQEFCFVLSRPPVSPYLNPIENVWALLKSGLREKNVTGGNDEFLMSQQKLYEIQDTLLFILSLRKRLLQVIDAGVGHTKY